jgi:hypothetical protein
MKSLRFQKVRPVRLARVMKALRLLGAFLLSSFGLVACADTSEDTESSDGAVTEGAINVKDANVEICGKSGDNEGCDLCPEKIGTQTEDPKMRDITWVQLSASDREACTLRKFRADLKNKLGVVISSINRVDKGGLFIPTAEGETKVRLVRISLTTAVAGARGADIQSERVSGSFTAGEDSGVEGSLSVFSVYMPIKLTFTFKDDAENGVTHNYEMQGTYGIVPYMAMHSKLAINLNVGSILSKFGPGSSIGGALLTALGGKLNASFAAEKTFSFNVPRCADASFEATKPESNHYEAFDKDFFRNVLGPFCAEYARHHEGVKCSIGGAAGGPAVSMDSRATFFSSRRLHPMEGCGGAAAPWNGFNTSKWSFLAPMDWGYASGQKVYLYRRSNGTIFNREHAAKVLDFDVPGEGKKCGGKAIPADQVCVHALVVNRVLEHYDDADCTEAQGLAAKNQALFAVSQDDASNTDGFIDMPN